MIKNFMDVPAKDTAVPPEKVMQYILLFLIVTIPALGNYLELMNPDVAQAKVQHLGLVWLIGYASFSATVLVLGMYFIFNNALRNLIFGSKNRHEN